MYLKGGERRGEEGRGGEGRGGEAMFPGTSTSLPWALSMRRTLGSGMLALIEAMVFRDVDLQGIPLVEEEHATAKRLASQRGAVEGDCLPVLR